MKEFLVRQALKSSMGMGKDVLRRFRRNIGSLLRDLGGGYTGASLLLILAAQSLNIPLHGPLYVEAWGGKKTEKEKQHKLTHRFRFSLFFLLFFFCPPPPKVCTYSGPCEEPCSRSVWPAATKGSSYVSAYLLRKDTKNPKSGLKQKTQKLGPVVRRVLLFFALEPTELVSHRADFFDFFYMRTNKIRHICGLWSRHLYGRGCKTFNLLKPPCWSVHSSVHS